ncbi:MAG: hypothetical protein Q8R92_11405 [Deltaproteobacteria bacterium]|nr:hypothetical protein [Deltaproteobacteria bacterium]
MNETLDKLRRLQDDDSLIGSLKAEISTQPQKLAEISAKRDAAHAEVKAAEVHLEGIEHNRRDREGEAQTEGERLKKYKTQLSQVKTNKEYTTMLHEIETTEKKIGDLEEQILIGMEEADAGKTRLAGAKASAALTEQTCREEEEKVRARTADAEGELAAAEADRKGLAGEIDAETLGRYEKVRSARRGIAVARVRDSICQACGGELLRQIYNDLFKDDAIHTCPGCQRIIYVAPEAEEGKG